MDHSQHQMIAEFSYWLAFTTGILGSGHCIGMCGALVSGFFLKFAGQDKSLLPVAAYHAARLTMYTLVGLIAAALGAVLVQTGIVGKAQGILQIVAGIVVILLGLETMGMSPWRLTFAFAKVSWLHRLLFEAPKRGPVLGAAIGGMVNGLMPCSMTMAMAVKATTAASPLEGGLLLLAFGAGTLPSMLFVSLLFGKLGVKVRGMLLKGAAVIVILLGLATVYQGIAYYGIMSKLGNW
jgi:sulfite exporter TauE/SafE